MLTVLGSRYVRLGRLRRFARTSLVDGSHAEFVWSSLDQVINSAAVRIAIDFRTLFPGRTVLITFLYDVTGYW